CPLGGVTNEKSRWSLVGCVAGRTATGGPSSLGSPEHGDLRPGRHRDGELSLERGEDDGIACEAVAQRSGHGSYRPAPGAPTPAIPRRSPTGRPAPPRPAPAPRPTLSAEEGGTHTIMLDLSGGGCTRQVCHGGHCARVLEARQPGLEIGTQLSHARCRDVVVHDEHGADDLAPDIVGQSDDGDLAYPGEPADGRLHFA